jgi:branched-chain amino acid transport system substrate-binding protein
VTPVADEVVTPEHKDFNSNLAKIRQQSPDVLFIGAEEVQSGLIAKQARELGLKAIFAGGAPMGTDVYATTAGLANAEGSVVSSPYLSNEASPAIKDFAAKYKAAYGEDARMHVAKAYDGAQILIEALKQTNGEGGQKLADAIRGVKRDGLLGQYNYNEFGVGIHETKIGLIKEGKAVPAAES